MTEFPRGWTVNTFQNATGTQPTITIAAAAGVEHVLDSLYAKAQNFGAGATAGLIIVTVVTAAGTVLSAGLSLAAGAVNADSVSFSGLDIASVVGAAIVINANFAPPAGYSCELTAQGHDI